MLPKIAIVFSAVLAVSASNEWRAPGETDRRSPCPMVNSLANHGYLPYDGLNISLADLIVAFTDAVNLDPAATTLVGQKAVTTGNNVTFDLDMLDKHGIIEHDGSLSRNDVYFGDNHSFNRTIWSSVSSHFNQSTISIQTAAAARKARLQAAAAANPQFSLPADAVQFSFIETALYLSVFGNVQDGNAVTEWVKILFEQERLPFREGFTRSDTVITAAGILGLNYVVIFDMTESREPSEGMTASSSHQTQISFTPGVSPVQIILTPPTPIVGNTGSARREEDTHKEVTPLNQITEEDEKEVYSPNNAVQARHVDSSEKEVYRPAPSVDGAEKEWCGPQTRLVQPGHVYMDEKEALGQVQNVVGSPQPIETQSVENQAQASVVQRQLNNVSVAVEKRKKALSTFTTQSNTRMRESYTRMGQSVTDRSVAIERGASNRLSRREKDFNDQINRAGKIVNARVTSLKHSVDAIKKVGSRTRGSERESERRQSE